MKSDFKFKLGGPKKLVTVLGLALDGARLDGVVLRRTNGSLAVLQSFSATLALDPLTAAPELVAITLTMLAPIARRMSIPNRRVSDGTMRMPPPTPARAPIRPAAMLIAKMPTSAPRLT